MQTHEYLGAIHRALKALEPLSSNTDKVAYLTLLDYIRERLSELIDYISQASYRG